MADNVQKLQSEVSTLKRKASPNEGEGPSTSKKSTLEGDIGNDSFDSEAEDEGETININNIDQLFVNQETEIEESEFFAELENLF